jgi:hypothetical protein
MLAFFEDLLYYKDMQLKQLLKILQSFLFFCSGICFFKWVEYIVGMGKIISWDTHPAPIPINEILGINIGVM